MSGPAMSEWDVVVVGAGPAGAVSAAQLAKRGYRVALLDRARFPRHKACAEYLSPGVHEVARRLGIWEAIRCGLPCTVPGMEVVSPKGTVLRLQYSVDGRQRHAATLPRHVLDAQLVAHAEASGAEMISGVIAHEPIMRAGVVSGVSASREGATIRFPAKLTVVADGNRSTIAKALDFAVLPRWPVRMGLVAHYEGSAPLRDGFGQMHVAVGGYCGVAPLPGGRLNVAIVVKADAVTCAGTKATEYFENWIDEMPALRALLSDCIRISPVRGVGPIGSRVRRVSTAGALLVGDAAGFFDPFTGEGIYRALRGAELIAEVGHDALLRQDVSAESLARYDSLRSRAFRRKHAVTALVQLFVQFPALMEYALPRLARRPGSLQALGSVLGDCQDAETFLNVPTVWSALRP
jgi:geranylgeranyl reductase family protein